MEVAIHQVSKVDITVRQFTDGPGPAFSVTELCVHYTGNDGHECKAEMKLFGPTTGIPFGQIGQAIAEKAKEA
jgi:hypothetical protein